jgi:hypothetical protein
MFYELNHVNCTVKKAVEPLDVPSRNTYLTLKKYNSNVEQPPSTKGNVKTVTSSLNILTQALAEFIDP